MAQVQTPREFKFVGGPSRKRRRNGAPAAASVTASKQTKRSCVPPPTATASSSIARQAVRPPSPLPLYHVDLLPSPRSVFASLPLEPAVTGATLDILGSVHPDITSAITATLEGSASSLDGHNSSSPYHSSSPSGGSSSSESVAGDTTTAPSSGLEGILDWPSDPFMNPFFSAVSMDSTMFGGMLGCAADGHDVQPATSLLLQTPPPMSSLPSFPQPQPQSPLAEEVEELPSHLDAAIAGLPLQSPPPVFFDAGKQPSISADSLLMVTSPRMYAQPSNLYDTISRIFFQYDQEFCILPLTCDFAANPFRYNMQTMQQSSLLRHCILALSYKHVDYDTGACTTEATAYKRRATQMLQDKMQSEAAGEGQPDASLLDASIVMMSLDCATSALGPWVSHLRRAKRILQSTAPTAGAPSNFASSSSSASASSTPSSSSPPRSASQRLAQLGLLVWFDVTLALTSRNGCVFPERTILSIFDTPSDSGGAGDGSGPGGSPTEGAALDFYAISGCPRELFECMVRLAAYARELQITSTLSCVRFDMAPVLRLERRIAQWKSPAFDDPLRAQDLLDMVMRGRRPFAGRGDGEDGSSDSAAAAELAAAEKLWRTRNIAVDGEDDCGSVVDYRLDLYHCAEAWRCALLIYIERVFKWQNRKWQAERRRRRRSHESEEEEENADEASNMKDDADREEDRAVLQFLARRTLNHVTSCRRTTFVQKQLMLPVFLAGAETRDAGLRNDAREYCVWWGSKTRYNMFITSRALLEEVWRREDVWWGDVFDEKSKRGEKEYLLG